MPKLQKLCDHCRPTGSGRAVEVVGRRYTQTCELMSIEPARDDCAMHCCSGQQCCDDTWGVQFVYAPQKIMHNDADAC